MTEIARAGARVGTLVAVSVAILLRGFLGGDVPVRVEAYDGSALGPVGARTVLRLRSPDAIRRVLLSPGELGIARAYVAGDLDIARGTANGGTRPPSPTTTTCPTRSTASCWARR